jgi:hypothetical protein
MATQNELKSLQQTMAKLNANPVERFSYTQNAYDNEIIDGVDLFDSTAEQNIPKASLTDYNPVVLDRGVRAQGASIPRMAWNHFLGRLSFNLNMLIRKMDMFFTVLRRSQAHNANEYDSHAEYALGDVCFVVETLQAGSHAYTWYRRISTSPLHISGISPASASDWEPLNETTVLDLASDTAPLMDGTSAVGTSLSYAREDHVHPIDTSRAPDQTTLTNADAAATLPATGTVKSIAQTVRNCLKWLVGKFDASAGHAHNGSDSPKIAYSNILDPVDTRGITQLTGDVAAPETANGSAEATLAASGVAAGDYGDGGGSRVLAHEGQFTIPKKLVVDAKGRVTQAEAITLTLPSVPNDTRGITQLTGDVTTPDTANGPAEATIKESVGLTGSPTAPTAASGAADTQIATTAFVDGEKGYVKRSDPGARAGQSRLWVNSDGLLAVDNHLVEWGVGVDIDDLYFRAEEGESKVIPIEVSGIYRYVLAGAKGGKGANSLSLDGFGGAGGRGEKREGVISLTAQNMVRIECGKSADSAAPPKGVFMALGLGYVYYSTDGINWAPKYPVDDGFRQRKHLAYAGGRFTDIQSASNQTNTYLEYFANGNFLSRSSINSSGSAAYQALTVENRSVVLYHGNAGVNIGIAYGGTFNSKLASFPGGSSEGYYPDNITATGLASYSGKIAAVLCVASLSVLVFYYMDNNNSYVYKVHNYTHNFQDIAAVGSFVLAMGSDDGHTYFTKLHKDAASDLPVIATLNTPTLYRKLCSGGGLVVALGGALCAVSADGYNWSYDNPILDGVTSFNDIIYAKDRFVAVGDGGHIMWSTDGISWEPMCPPIGEGLTSVAFGPEAPVGGGVGGSAALVNESFGSPALEAAGGAGGGGAYEASTSSVGKTGESSAVAAGGAGGTNNHRSGYDAEDPPSPNTEEAGYALLVYQRPQ